MLRRDRLPPRDPRVHHRLLLASERNDDEIGRAREGIGKLERATLQVTCCEMREANDLRHVHCRVAHGAFVTLNIMLRRRSGRLPRALDVVQMSPPSAMAWAWSRIATPPSTTGPS